jgi:uncharacterized membrane protein
MMKKILSWFFRGLVLVIPVAATLYVLIMGFRFIDGLLPVRVPGLGFVLVIALITLLGLLSPRLLAMPLISLVEHGLEKVPLVKVIYSAVRDLMSAFVGDNRRFSEPVLVTVGQGANLHKIGFVTRKDLSALGIKDKVAVYLPHSYNFSGNLVIVPKENVTPLPISPAEAMKFIVTGGVTGI